MYNFKDYLTTLRRIPDEVVLDLATRDLELSRPNACVCGWAVRCGLSRLRQTDASDIDIPKFTEFGFDATRHNVLTSLQAMFGGAFDEWERVYDGVIDTLQAPKIERALLQRIVEAVEA